MQTHFVRLGRRYKIPASIQIKHELRQMMRGGEAARARPDVTTGPSDRPWADPGADVGAVCPPAI